jgi:phosphatidylserine/phosphatidylglycerophosphate/cardiolipin synthase-like enzyme
MLALAIIGGAFIAWFVLAMLFTPVVSDIQGVVAETWLECRGEILTGPETYEPHERAGDVAAFAIKSSPADRSTASRVLFQTLVEAANRSVRISTPYFLPDEAFRRACIRVARRGVDITVVVPGPRTDNRSFEHNDEVNAAFRDAGVAARFACDFGRDRQASSEITLERWPPARVGKAHRNHRIDPRAAAVNARGDAAAGYGWRGVSIAPPFACTLVLVNKR